MNMQAGVKGAVPSWVTVVEAARILTAAGDTIDASNVSRYLIRYPEIASKREGKCRRVDLVALAEHRRTNVNVADKQAARAVPSVVPIVAAPPQPAPVSALEPAPEGAADGPEEGTLGAINLQIKALDLRKRQREEDLADGTVVPATEVLMVISATMQSFIAGLERAEIDIAQRYGREISAAVRKARKGAQGDAARVLGDLARRHLPASMGGQVTESATPAEEPPPETPAT